MRGSFDDAEQQRDGSGDQQRGAGQVEVGVVAGQPGREPGGEQGEQPGDRDGDEEQRLPRQAQAWHPRHDADAAHAWLRATVRRVVEDSGRRQVAEEG
ncbi:hypothetical protein ACWDLG_18310 [Nonomuraea sp. NPDC003727]